MSTSSCSNYCIIGSLLFFFENLSCRFDFYQLNSDINSDMFLYFHHNALTYRFIFSNKADTTQLQALAYSFKHAVNVMYRQEILKCKNGDKVSTCYHFFIEKKRRHVIKKKDNNNSDSTFQCHKYTY